MNVTVAPGAEDDESPKAIHLPTGDLGRLAAELVLARLQSDRSHDKPASRFIELPVELVVRKSTWDQVGGMDRKNLVVAFNDVDFCLRLREAGYRTGFIGKFGVGDAKHISSKAADSSR